MVDAETDLESLFFQDRWRMRVLNALYDLDLDHAYVTGRFVRDAVWDAAHGRAPQPIEPVEVTYADPDRTDPNIDAQLEVELLAKAPNKAWRVVNAARSSTAVQTMDEALLAAPDTTRAIGIRLLRGQKLEILAPYGLDDVLNMVVRPTSGGSLDALRQEAEAAGWLRRFSRVTFEA